MRPIDSMDDRELNRINGAYPWITYCLDAKGRRVGKPDGQYYAMPHPLVLETDRRIGLAGKTVVEFGSLEGSHTVALSERAGRVIAVECRDSNIQKTKMRCSLFGFTPEILKLDVETQMPPPADVYYHSGVLYHLQDPIVHLHKVSESARDLVLDTHYTKTPNAKYLPAMGGRKYRCYEYPEQPKEFKAGLRRFSRWLLLDDLLEKLNEIYSSVKVHSDRSERNGPRVTIFARSSRILKVRPS